MYKIYTLSLKDNPEFVRYIGYTKQTLKQRLNKHRHYPKISNNKRANWIRKHKNDILISKLDSCNTIEEAHELEVQYIKLYKACGADLINLTNGGYSGDFLIAYNNLEENRRKTREAQIQSIGKKVIQYNLDGIKLNEFSTISEASRQTKLNISSIIQSTKNYRVVGNKYIFLKTSDTFNINNLKKYKVIECIDIKTGILKVYIGLKILEKVVGKEKSIIARYIKKGKPLNGFLLKYLN